MAQQTSSAREDQSNTAQSVVIAVTTAVLESLDPSLPLEEGETNLSGDYCKPIAHLDQDFQTKKEPLALRWAYRLFWCTFSWFFASTALGKLWDRVWHLTHYFDTFWSPPHLFIFVMTMLTGLAITLIAFIPRLRIWFGPCLCIPFIPFPVPGALVIISAGLLALSCTIQFDNLWHSTFGLDETQWSGPHNMLTWSWLTIILGFVAARLAFRPHRPIGRITELVMTVMVLEFLCPPILGPFYLNYTPALLRAMQQMPIVQQEPTAQHVYHIYLQFGLTRLTSPLFIPLAGGLFTGIATAFLQRLNRSGRTSLIAALIWSLTLMARDLYTILFLHYKGIKLWIQIIPVALKEPALWMPLPLVIAIVITHFLQKTSFTDNRITVICGCIGGLYLSAIWPVAGWQIGLVIAAGLTTLYGSWIGKWLYGLLEQPTFRDMTRWLLTICILIPVPLGLLDLCLRWSTPW